MAPVRQAPLDSKCEFAVAEFVQPERAPASPMRLLPGAGAEIRRVSVENAFRRAASRTARDIPEDADLQFISGLFSGRAVARLLQRRGRGL
jgi:hypothetical protein